MFDIGFSELLVIGLVALVVIGPERLPRVARTLGHLAGRLQRYDPRQLLLTGYGAVRSAAGQSARTFVTAFTKNAVGNVLDHDAARKAHRAQPTPSRGTGGTPARPGASHSSSSGTQPSTSNGFL